MVEQTLNGGNWYPVDEDRRPLGSNAVFQYRVGIEIRDLNGTQIGDFSNLIRTVTTHIACVPSITRPM